MATEIGFNAFASVLEERFGPPSDGEDVIDGLGTFDIQKLAFPCGLAVELWRARESFGGAVDFANEIARYTGGSTDADRAHVAFHLGIPLDSLWTVPRRGNAEQLAMPLRFTVMRRDDNGNEAEVTRTTNRCEADAIAAMYAARGHKQTYWVL
ncbi:MAG TPA: hypothetical protein VGM90_04715 [Kofleriaceae bacterium]